MTALVVVPTVKVRHGRPAIGRRAPVLAERELVCVGPVEAFENPSAARLRHLAADPTAILMGGLDAEQARTLLEPLDDARGLLGTLVMLNKRVRRQQAAVRGPDPVKKTPEA